MHVTTAYHRREELTDKELQWLHTALQEEAESYRFGIRNYPPDRMEKYGVPYLAKLEAKVAAVESILRKRNANPKS